MKHTCIPSNSLDAEREQKRILEHCKKEWEKVYSLLDSLSWSMVDLPDDSIEKEFNILFVRMRNLVEFATSVIQTKIEHPGESGLLKRIKALHLKWECHSVCSPQKLKRSEIEGLYLNIQREMESSLLGAIRRIEEIDSSVFQKVIQTLSQDLRQQFLHSHLLRDITKGLEINLLDSSSHSPDLPSFFKKDFAKDALEVFEKPEETCSLPRVRPPILPRYSCSPSSSKR